VSMAAHAATRAQPQPQPRTALTPPLSPSTPALHPHPHPSSTTLTLHPHPTHSLSTFHPHPHPRSHDGQEQGSTVLLLAADTSRDKFAWMEAMSRGCRMRSCPIECVADVLALRADKSEEQGAARASVRHGSCVDLFPDFSAVASTTVAPKLGSRVSSAPLPRSSLPSGPLEGSEKRDERYRGEKDRRPQKDHRPHEELSWEAWWNDYWEKYAPDFIRNA